MSEFGVDQFLEQVEGCFGNYPIVYRGHVQVWLEDIPQQQLPILLEVILEKFPIKWGKPPGIPELMDFHRTVRARGAEKKVALLEGRKQAEMIEGPKSELPDPDERDVEAFEEFMDAVHKLAREKNLRDRRW